MKKLLTNGDSWTYGSEISCPEILAVPGEKGFGMANRYKQGMHDTMQVNDYFRIPKIWPTHLSKLLDAENINISWPARSNDVIYTANSGWVLDYLAKGGDPADLTVVIGWSSPERRNILIQDFDDVLNRVTLWPAMDDDQYYPTDAAKRYFKFYVQHLWLEQEYITRWVEQNFNLHLFLKSKNINHKFFNAFWLWNHTPVPVHQWQDVNLLDVIERWRDVDLKGHHEQTWRKNEEIDRVKNMWKAIPDDVFMYKDTLRSFKWYVDQTVPTEDRMYNMHPSPTSHEVWAKHLSTVL